MVLSSIYYSPWATHSRLMENRIFIGFFGAARSSWRRLYPSVASVPISLAWLKAAYLVNVLFRMGARAFHVAHAKQLNVNTEQRKKRYIRTMQTTRQLNIPLNLAWVLCRCVCVRTREKWRARESVCGILYKAGAV